jgi:ATP-dependent DNA helicase PIF1
MTQEEALTILKTGTNVFLTGEPGSGKTHTVNTYVEWLRERGIEPSITASTGIAATHVSGMTIHAWSGIGVLRDLSEYELDRISSNERVSRRVRHTKILIIDEISMLASHTLSMVDAVCREIRGDSRPFGGLQVVFVGDFFQLPPVTRNDSQQQYQQEMVIGDIPRSNSSFAFSSVAWKTANPIVCYLTEQHRQEDSAFLEMLSAVRRSAITADHRRLLESRIDPAAEIDEATKLFPHNAAVDRMNDTALNALPEGSKKFLMDQRGPDHLTQALMRGCLSPETLVLKKGARVMFTKNDPMQRYANGTLGAVEAFESGTNNPIVTLSDDTTITVEPTEWKMEDSGKVLARIIQVPLRLAWAITVHKSQGMSLDSAVIDLSAAFEYGQGYVALSRVRTIEGLTLLGFNERALAVHPEISEQDEDFREASAVAEEAFDEMPNEEIEMLQKDFVTACGGSEPVAGVIRARGKKLAPKEASSDTTLAFIREGKSLADIVKERGIKTETVLQHIEELKLAGKLSQEDIQYLADGNEEEVSLIQAAFENLDTDKLRPVYDHFGGKLSYASIRLARLLGEE